MAPEQMAETAQDALPPPARPLDAIDQDILRILQADGRASVRSVAERVHVSRANAYARINRLVEDGVIRGFGARVDHERAGHSTSAYITLKIVQNTWRTVREQLRQLPGASHIALVGGDFDVLLLVHTPDNRALRELAAAVTRWQQALEQRSALEGANFDQVELLAWRTLGEALLLIDMYEQGSRGEGAAEPPVPSRSRSWWQRALRWVGR